MNKSKIVLDEECMKRFIQDLLCLENESTWKYTSMDTIVELTFHGNIHGVQKAIYEWLSIPPRKHNFELLGG